MLVASCSRLLGVWSCSCCELLFSEVLTLLPLSLQCCNVEADEPIQAEDKDPRDMEANVLHIFISFLCG